MKITFVNQIIWIRFIGTYPDYDRIDAKTIYWISLNKNNKYTGRFNRFFEKKINRKVSFIDYELKASLCLLYSNIGYKN